MRFSDIPIWLFHEDFISAYRSKLGIAPPGLQFWPIPIDHENGKEPNVCFQIMIRHVEILRYNLENIRSNNMQRKFELDFFPDPYSPNPLLFSIKLLGVYIGKKVPFTYFKVKSQVVGVCMLACACTYTHKRNIPPQFSFLHSRLAMSLVLLFHFLCVQNLVHLCREAIFQQESFQFWNIWCQIPA